MQNTEPMYLYCEDGSEVAARNFYDNPSSVLANGLVSDDGRGIGCTDKRAGTFWFRDTNELLYRDRPKD